MQTTPSIIFGLALFAYASIWVPDKYKPTWTHRLGSWQTLIGLVAVIAAILIMMNPEFYALGILGDSAFFDLLVLAITCQLHMFSSRIWSHIVAGFCMAKRFVRFRIFVTQTVMLFVLADIVATVQKVVHRISS
jgi:hypothetical protein